jgi:hypothetical protein
VESDQEIKRNEAFNGIIERVYQALEDGLEVDEVRDAVDQALETYSPPSEPEVITAQEE